MADKPGRPSKDFYVINGVRMNMRAWANRVADEAAVAEFGRHATDEEILKKLGGIRARHQQRKSGVPLTDYQVIYGIRDASSQFKQKKAAKTTHAELRESIAASLLKVLEGATNTLADDLQPLIRQFSPDKVSTVSSEQSAMEYMFNIYCIQMEKEGMFMGSRIPNGAILRDQLWADIQGMPLHYLNYPELKTAAGQYMREGMRVRTHVHEAHDEQQLFRAEIPPTPAQQPTPQPANYPDDDEESFPDEPYVITEIIEDDGTYTRIYPRGEKEREWDEFDDQYEAWKLEYPNPFNQFWHTPEHQKWRKDMEKVRAERWEKRWGWVPVVRIE